MAEYAYADFESQADDAARLTRLRLHLDEVRARMSATLSQEGKSRDTTPLVGYLNGLEERRQELQAAVNVNAGTAQRASFVRARVY